ncbi:MAG: HAD-IA family hydrolase [Lachnospiraceae bacterium]|nr:HAD-IA family hydrolase [Lachnospiraceae bacterium]
MRKCFIFDLDGTLLDTLADLTDAVNEILVRHGFPARTKEEVCSFVGNGLRMLMVRASGLPADDPLADELAMEQAAYYTVHANDRTVPYPGIHGMLAALAALPGVRLAVVSNKKNEIVGRLIDDHFPGLFESVLGEESGIPKKPDPAQVTATLRRLGVSEDEAVYIGDSDIDIRTAENAGIPCVSVVWGFRTEAFVRARGAQQVAHSAEELFGILRDWAGA